MRETRDQCKEEDERSADPDGLGMNQYLFGYLCPQIGFRCGPGHDDPRRCRNNEGRDLAYQSVSDCQKRIILCSGAKTHAMLKDPYDQSPDDINNGDDDPGNRIPPYKFTCAIHCPVEFSLAGNSQPAPPGFGIIYQSCIQIRINAHLLARHCIEGKPGGNLCDTAGALCNHHKVDDNQDHEQDHPDCIVSPHNKIAEGLDDL